MKESARLRSGNYNRRSNSMLVFLFNTIILSSQPITSFSTSKQEHYELSYNVPISSSKKFILQFNDQITCNSNDDYQTCTSTKILSFINHLIIETATKETLHEKSIQKILLEAEQTWLNNNTTTQKHCMMTQPGKNMCLLSYNKNNASLSTSLHAIVDGSGFLTMSFESNLKTNNAQEILISSAMELNSVLDEFTDSSPLWSITEKPPINGISSKQINEDELLSHKGKMLSNPYLDKKRTYCDTTKPDNMAEIWEYKDTITSTDSRSLYINSILRYLSNNNAIIPPSNAHAESFIHPALLNHPRPTRIAILSKMPLAYIREVIKYDSIETIDILGSLNEEMLNHVIDKMPELNDCSGFVGINEQCMDNTNIITLLDNNVDEWLNQMIKKDEEIEDQNEEDATKVNYATYPKYDIIYIDAPSSSSLEELNWLRTSFIKNITQLLDFNQKESMIVISSGYAPTSTSTTTLSEELRYELLLKGSLRKQQEIDIEAIVIYEEELAQPLNTAFIILFHSLEYSYTNFFRDKSTAFDIDIIRNFRTLKKDASPTMLYDGPTHDRYKQPSRIWERWFCSQHPWKDYHLCSTFYHQFFNKEYHHFNTEVRDHPVKNRALYTVDKVKEGHFINADDDSTALHIDLIQWEELSKFVNDIPTATMYKELKDFFLAYGWETDILGFTGWNVALASNQTFTNHACTEEEKTASSFDKAFETDEDGYGKFVSFNPALQRRPSLFSSLTVATRDLDIGEELMVDYSMFRDVVDEDFQLFLEKICDTGVGLVPNRDGEEGIFK